MQRLLDDDIDPTALAGKRIAIVGYGNQGRAQALNLHDSGLAVTVALREGSPSAARVAADGFASASIEEAIASADVVMLLLPDEAMAAAYAAVEPHLKPGAALGFAHGLAIHFGLIHPRADLDVFLLAPKGPGTALRSLYLDGKGMLGLVAVAQDASGNARAIALAYGRALGCGRAGLVDSSFEEECVADLFNEQAVVWGGVPDLLVAGFDTLVESGISPEVAYLECVSELQLLSQLIEARGIAAMREAISNTAELGAVVGGPRIVDEGVRARMREILAEVRAGDFTRQLERDRAEGYPILEKARARARALAVETARRSIEG